jgi:hypothetical protein
MESSMLLTMFMNQYLHSHTMGMKALFTDHSLSGFADTITHITH